MLLIIKKRDWGTELCGFGIIEFILNNSLHVLCDEVRQGVCSLSQGGCWDGLQCLLSLLSSS